MHMACFKIIHKIWINFHNAQIGTNTQIKHTHIQFFFTMEKKWTPIKKIYFEIQIGNNPFHNITIIQVFIQLDVRCTVHHA
jgi:hypothetical protein